MLTLEQSVKNHFAKVFSDSDWRLFKEMAGFYLTEAAFLKKSSLNVPQSMQLLVRNSRKRLYIGIGVELLLKAVYLKAGYGINKSKDRKQGLEFPFKLIEVNHKHSLNPSDTYTLDQLTTQLKKVITLPPKSEIVMNGLKIAKVFRNKEGHIVTQTHEFDPLSYQAIETMLVEIYRIAFEEKLSVKFSFAVGEKGVWHVSKFE